MAVKPETYLELYDTIAVIYDTYKSLTKKDLYKSIDEYFNTTNLGKKIQQDQSRFTEIGFYPSPKVYRDNNVYPTDIIQFLKERYLGNKESIIKYDLNSVYYCYYYNGSSNYKLAILKVNIVENEWENCEMFYFKDDGKFSSKFQLNRILPHDQIKSNPEYLYFSGISNNSKLVHQVNFYTIKIGQRPHDSRYMMFVSSSNLSYIEGENTQSINFGLLERINFHEIESKRQSPVSAWIKTALINGKINFNRTQQSVFTSLEKFEKEKKVNKNFECCKRIAGVYLGIYLKANIEDDDEKESGGIALVLGEILDSSEVILHFIKNNERDTTYKGHIMFWKGQYQTVKIDLDYHESLYRFSIILKEASNSNYFKGVISGINDSTPFSSPMFIKRIKTQLSFEELFDLIEPSRIHKSKFNIFFQNLSKKISIIDFEKVYDIIYESFEKYFENPNKYFNPKLEKNKQ